MTYEQSVLKELLAWYKQIEEPGNLPNWEKISGIVRNAKKCVKPDKLFVVVHSNLRGISYDFASFTDFYEARAFAWNNKLLGLRVEERSAV